MIADGAALSLAVSFAAVLVLIGVSYALGAWRSTQVTRDGAAGRLAFDEPDFCVEEWLIGADGKSAAAISAAGEIALVFSVGDDLATRRFPRGRLAVERRGAVIIFRVNEPSLPAVQLAAAEDAAAAQWLSRLRARAL